MSPPTARRSRKAADRGPPGPGPGGWSLAAQLGVLFVVAVAVGLALPRGGLGTGIAAGLLACVTAAASLAARAAWQRLRARHPQLGRHDAEVLAREVVRCGVVLLVVLGVIGPLSLGADRLPVWFLAALVAGGAATLPAGLVVELRALSDASSSAGALDPRAGWTAAVVVAAVVGLLAGLLVALAGTTPLSVALRWVATAVAGFALGAGPRLVRRPGGQP